MKTKNLSIMCIIVFISLHLVYGSTTTTTAGIKMDYNISVNSESPNRVTIQDAAMSQYVYVNRNTDFSSNEMTYTSFDIYNYPYQTYVNIYESLDLTTKKCSTTITNNECSFSYITYPTDILLIEICNEFKGCARMLRTHAQKDIGEYVQNGMILTLSASQSSTKDKSLYTVSYQTNNYFSRLTNINDIIYTGSLSSEYKYDSYYKIYNKSNSNIFCQSTIASNQCLIPYSNIPISEPDTYYMFCNEFGGCSRGIEEYYHSGDTGELTDAGFTIKYTLSIDKLTPPSYIYPTPTNGARKYNPQNFTIKINATGNLDNAIITINSQNYSMQNTSDIYYYTYNFTDITSIETVTFQVHYNKSGTVNSIEQRTAYAYPPRESAGQVPFTTPIVYLLSLILILIPLSIKTKSKNKSKKAIGPVVATALLLVVAVVTLISFQGWYQTYQSDILSKTERKSNIDSSIIFIERTEQTTSGTNIMIRNQGSAYYVITELKINSQQCNLLGSDIIGENTVTTIETDCTSIRNQAAEIAVFTDLGIFSEEEMIK
jgi:hypothetical protein